MKRKQTRAKLEALETAEIQEKYVEPTALENELQCPRCSDMLVLCSGFDYLYYSCDECGFVLSNLKK